MKTRTKPTVGQTVYMICLYGRGNELVPVTVAEVGRKYFKLAHHYRPRFHNDTWKHDSGDYSEGYQLYASEQERSDSVERSQLVTEMGRIPFYLLSLDQLRRIKAITKETPN